MATIALDARKYFDFGIGTCIRNLMKSFSGFSHGHSFLIIVSQQDEEKIPLPPHSEKFVAKYGKYSFGEFVFLGRRVRKKGVDLYHSPHYTLPLGLGGSSVVTIHDLIPLRFPGYFNAVKKACAWALMKHAVRNAGAIITDSEFSRRDLLEMFRVPEEKVHAIHCGVDSQYARLQDGERIQSIRRMYGLESPFVLYVGSLKPHKNIPTLLEAFSLLAKKNVEVNLVFVGESLSSRSSLAGKAEALGLVGRIHDLGFVSGEDLAAIYNCAEMVVLPSLYEGFGLPAIEAMACGTPAIVSNATSLPEVAGRGALVVDPRSAGEWAEAMKSILEDSSLRGDLIARGFENASRYSWKRNARETLRIYSSLL